MPRSRFFGALAVAWAITTAPALAVGDAATSPRLEDSTSLVADREMLELFLDQLAPVFEQGFGITEKQILLELTEQIDLTGEEQTVSFRVLYEGRPELLRVNVLPARGNYDATFYASQQVTAAIHAKFALLARSARKRALR
jgi:hypothetical protein